MKGLYEETGSAAEAAEYEVEVTGGGEPPDGERDEKVTQSGTNNGESKATAVNSLDGVAAPDGVVRGTLLDSDGGGAAAARGGDEVYSYEAVDTLASGGAAGGVDKVTQCDTSEGESKAAAVNSLDGFAAPEGDYNIQKESMDTQIEAQDTVTEQQLRRGLAPFPPLRL